MRTGKNRETGKFSGNLGMLVIIRFSYLCNGKNKSRLSIFRPSAQFHTSGIQSVCPLLFLPNPSAFSALPALRLQARAVLRGRNAEVLGAIAAEIGQGTEVHGVGNLRQREAAVVEVVLENRDGVAVDERENVGARRAFHDFGKVFGRHVQLPGVIFHGALRAASAGRKQADEFLNHVASAVGAVLCLVSAGMDGEQVVHHQAADAADHLLKKEVGAGLFHAVGEQTDVGQKQLGLVGCGMDDGVGVEADAPTNGKTVGGQLVVEEVVGGGEVLDFQIWTGAQVLQSVGQGQNQDVAGTKVKAFVVEHEAAFALQTEQMGAGAVQPCMVDALKISGINQSSFPNPFARSAWRRTSPFFDFSLTEAELREIKALDLKKSQWFEHHDPETVKMFMGWK